MSDSPSSGNGLWIIEPSAGAHPILPVSRIAKQFKLTAPPTLTFYYVEAHISETPD
jgi:hypothetical protein